MEATALRRNKLLTVYSGVADLGCVPPALAGGTRSVSAAPTSEDRDAEKREELSLGSGRT